MPDSLTPPAPGLRVLLDRASVPPKTMREPAPSPADLETAVSAALRAPDHGGLRPWRFVFVEGAARHALGDLFVASALRRAPDTPPEHLEIERAKPLRAPLVVVAGASIRYDRPGVPPWEQEASAAAGAMNFLNAIDAMGYAAFWASSETLRDPVAKVALGFRETDTMLGWIYVGTAPADRPHPQRPGPEGFYRHWQPGPGA
ncbi:nitroreductase family protein [Muricoccus radiodurans]|uniref:nitroreductase family protein n=1 Tax=Muricoccus radiodurans TaxID=2231721 RepID=UPI003CEFAC3E